MLQAVELGCAEVQFVEFPLDLQLFGDQIEARFLGATGIADCSGNLAAAELFIACFYHLELLFFGLDLRILSASFAQQLHIVAFTAPYFVHDGAKLAVDVLCDGGTQRFVGIGEFLFKKAKVVLCNIVVGLDAVDLCISLDEFVEQLLGVAGKLIDLMLGHIF